MYSSITTRPRKTIAFKKAQNKLPTNRLVVYATKIIPKKRGERVYDNPSSYVTWTRLLTPADMVTLVQNDESDMGTAGKSEESE